MHQKPRILVFASGSATGGGSGFQKMVEMSRGSHPVLDANIVGVVSNHAAGGIAAKARRLGVRFGHWTGPYDAAGYQRWVRDFEADYVMCSGWLKYVLGLDMARTVNIHPGPLPLTAGLHGHHVHEAVMRAYAEGAIDHSAVNIHFVDSDPDAGYDTGSVAQCIRLPVLDDDTPETLASRVNACEHAWQSLILNEIVHGRIWLDGCQVHSDGIPLLRE